MSDTISRELLQAIWDRHGLGKIETLLQPKQGNVNQSWIINDRHLIRFDVIDWKGITRYTGEQQAYDLLHGSDVPVPRVLILDTTKQLASYDYLILSKMRGKTISDSISELSKEAQSKLAYRAGECLATIHSYPLDNFGLLFEIRAGRNKPSWAEFVSDFYKNYGQQSLELGLIPNELLARIYTLMEKMQPLFASVKQGCLVHGDYHFSNLLQEDAQLSAVLDFEWAMSGDPSWDFRIDDDLDLEAEGSKKAFYEGYTSRRALPEQHEQRVSFYRIGLYLDFLTTFATEDAEEANRLRSLLNKEIAWLESHL